MTVAEYKKFVVVGVWGQSNAVGYDESALTDDDTPKFPHRVKQIPADSDAISNLTACARNYQDMNQANKGGASYNAATYGNSTEAFLNSRTDKLGNTRIGTKGIHLPLGELILQAIPEDYGVLIVPYAAGGKPIDFFNTANYYTAFANKIKVALATHADSKLAGIIWCQGENNAGNTTASDYKTKFESLVSNVNALLESEKSKTVNNNVDWFFYEFPKHYRNTGSGENSGQAIMGAIKQVLGESHYTAIDENHPVNETTYTTSTKAAHYGQNYYRTHIAPAVFATMKNAGAFNINK